MNAMETSVITDASNQSQPPHTQFNATVRRHFLCSSPMPPVAFFVSPRVHISSSHHNILLFHQSLTKSTLTRFRWPPSTATARRSPDAWPR
jgi:hypothetical protein